MFRHLTTAFCAVTILAAASPAAAAVQTKAQAKCVGALNASGLGVSRAVLKLVASCVKADAKGKLTGDVVDCVEADAKGKLAAAVAKTLAQETKLCAAPATPDFASTSGAVVNSASNGETFSLVNDLLDFPPPAAAGDKTVDGCRSAALGATGKLLAAELGAFNACKKSALATADDAADIAACLGQVATDKKVIKARDGVGAMSASRCPDAAVADALPGLCAAATGAALDSCLTSRASCRACEALAAMDALALDCDLFDDGAPNLSCPGGTVTTTTTTSTTSTTSTTTTTTTSTTTSTTTTTTLPHPSCAALLAAEPTATSGVYTIHPDGVPAFDAYCDMTTAGGGWTVFQRRFDGSVSFMQNWAEYAAGFGTAAGEHWLGNEKIHALTATGSHELYIALNDGTTDGFARYSTFSVSSAAGLYALTVGGFSGDAGDGLSMHSGRSFSTRDSDNDIFAGDCSHSYGQSGWWFSACHDGDLNGIYFTPGPVMTYADGVTWYPWRGFYFSLTSSKMMLR